MGKIVENYMDKLFIGESPLLGPRLISSGIPFRSAFDIYKKYIEKVIRNCNLIKTKDFNKGAICNLTYRIKASGVFINELRKNIGKCYKTKDPNNCKLKINNRIQKEKKNIKDLKERLKERISKNKK